MIREGLAGLLATYEEIEVVGSSSNGPELVTLAEQTRPDLVIMQIEEPIQRGKGNLYRVLAFFPPPKVLIVTMFENPGYVRNFLKLGASAYLMKNVEVEDLVGVIRAVAKDTEGAKNIVLKIPKEMLELSSDGFHAVLSEREMEVLLLVARGLSNRRIATTLHLSESTIRRHLANIYPNMEVGSRTEAAEKALAEGWISVPDIAEEVK